MRGDVEQIIDEPGQVGDLAIHQLASPSELGLIRHEPTHYVHGVADGGQGVAKLVGQHR